MPRIRINGRYYIVRERSTSAGRRGTIRGRWNPIIKKKGRKKDFWDMFR